MSSKKRLAPPQSSSASSKTPEVSLNGTSSASSQTATNDTSSDWFGQMVAGEATHQGIEDGVSRPDKAVRKGVSGALISSDDIELYATFEDTESSLKLKSGLPVKVLTSKDGWIEVEYRQGKTAKTGWVDGSTFSDQPGLALDDGVEGGLVDDYMWKKIDGDQTTKDLAANQVEQGALGDCFFIASMNAIGAANADFLEESIRYNADKDSYSVRFFEGTYGSPREVWIEVDSYLPMRKDGSSTYGGSVNGGTMWGPLIEKAYAKFKGGYNVIGEGGTGRIAMAELTGNRSRTNDPGSMKEDEVIPFFENAKEEGLAIYAGVRDTVDMESVSPFSGSGKGPHKATLPKSHDWNEIQHGTLSISHPDGEVRKARDTGSDGDKSASITGSDVAMGNVEYAANRVELEYTKEVTDASKLVVDYAAHGVVLPSKMLIGNHAYSFLNVVDGDKLQFYNPWGSYQPKAITAAEFLENFDSLATNQVPKAKTAGDE